MVAGSKLVRIAIGGEHALSDSRTAVNIWVSPQEREFLKRLELLFLKIGKANRHSDLTSGLLVQDFEESNS
jgi:hypothetical protein